jgi:hypothetical protein
MGIATLRVDLVDDDLEPLELEEATRRMRDALLQLEVEEVDNASGGSAPEGSKSADFAVLGGLVITLLQTPQLFQSVFGVLGTWLSGRSARTLKITLDGDTLELGAASDDERRAVVETWLERHRDAPGSSAT